MNSLPAGSSFTMPAEWEPHEGTWLQWPHNISEPGYEMKLEHTWLNMVAALYEREQVHVISADERQRDHITYQLKYFGISGGVDLHIIPTNDIWARDNGPIFVFDDHGEIAITNWIFNGWGNRFDHNLDNQVPQALGELLKLPVFDIPLVLEGGAVEVNGAGTLLATRSSIIDERRNPGKTQEEIEEVLGRYLGVDHFVWLSGAGRGEGETWGDTTDSHIDIVARFTDVSTVMYNWTDDHSDPRYPMFARHRDELLAAETKDGRPLSIVPLPVPINGVYQVAADSHWRTTRYTDAVYTNYLVANGVVLVPVFGNAHDERAKSIIQEQFPDRDIVPIDAVSLNEEGGAVHCVTQQQPARRASDDDEIWASGS